ncbi:ATP-binding protein [Cystobacter ferrugineus]|uniref:histidine kinase n=1 Tax=Cystobacter ferrugineus TaxID=83449 RepID=A0A1L9BEV1_9BACT|nr:ATP-binding protein [Cystobacter ferrugineus]OJH40755.1 hybrid sensor histidine kinase/response regulator [Cystobacter ferrugineus]
MRARFAQRTLLATGVLALLCVVFVLGRPLPSSEYDQYRLRLRQLRVQSSELERDLLQFHLGLSGTADIPPESFARLRGEVESLRRFPPQLLAEEQQRLSTALDNFVRALVDEELLHTRLHQLEQRRDELQTNLERTSSEFAVRSPPGEPRERLQMLTRAIRGGAEDGDLPHLEGALAALARELAGQPGEEASRAKLEADARSLLARTKEARETLQLLMERTATPAAEQIITTYFQLHERAQTRAERFRIVLFVITLLLAAFVLLVLWRLTRASKELDTLNAELERRVEERTAALSTANTELRESEARKAAILESALDGIITLDEAGRILDFNPAAEHIFRLRGAQAVGRDFLSLALSASVRPEQRTAVTRALRADAVAGQATRLELPVLRTDGSTFPAELTLLRVRSEGPPRFTTYVRDITERQEVERLKNEFVSTVSHELRTPLTSIRGSLGLLDGGILGELPAAARDMVRIACSNTERLIRLINDILDLEKMESGMLELKLQPVESADVIETTFSGVQAMADGARVRLRHQVIGAGTVRADRDRLIQVLTNLVSNAIKFSPVDGEVEVIAAQDARGQVRFTVKDQGPGIPPDKRDRLFGKFQQIDSSDSRTKGGTGLGLAISQAIVEQHGGHIEVHGEPGEGAIFSFALPSGRAGSGVVSRVKDDSRHSILVVTTDAELSGRMRGLLTHEGYRVLRTPSLEEAERLIDVGAPDALVVDPRQTDGRELDFVRRLREQPRTRELPIIMLTEQHEGSVQPLLVDWMLKPFDETRFLRTVRYAVRQPGQARVLLVDDDVSTRQVLRAQLERLGAVCYEAQDGEDAVALARATPPDLIVLDVGLPRMDGFEVVDILRQGKGRGTPLIVFTGRDLSSVDEHQLTLGHTRHHIKARTTEEALMTSVRELLNGLLAQHESGHGPHKEAS